MKDNTKIIIVMAFIAVVFLLAGGGIIEFFRSNPAKKELKIATKELEELREEVDIMLEEHRIELNNLQKRKANVNSKYEKASTVDHTIEQLDSLRSEYRRKTGS